MSSVQIFKVGQSEIIGYAALELQKYLEALSVDLAKVTVGNKEKYEEDEGPGIWIGLCTDFGVDCGVEVEDPAFDDGIHIDVQGARGIIAGINERSVLLGIYRFLWELGCRWVRPGKGGEFVPRKDLANTSVKLNEVPSYRHRGICIEGAVSYENVEDMIEWAPKVGFNSYFIQFREAYTFFERCYAHRGNPYQKPQPFSIKKAREYTKALEKEISKRGLIYHAVGHGWTCEPIGIPGLDWDTKVTEVTPGLSLYLAEVKGKREMWEGLPLNTNLCYSNPEVRDLMIEDIVAYLKNNRRVDILHFWLADGMNNQCECEECKKAIPSDFYVEMLNRLDEILTQEGINTKIVFLIYYDLLWAPQKEKIKNPDRFLLMFAPITRTYSHPYKPKGIEVTVPPYTRNELKFPKTVDENLAFLNQWREMFKGDGFDFDYHFMWDHFNDPAFYQVAKLLSEDIKSLKDIGLNGYMSCQTQRAFFPTGLGMVVMGRTLWNDKISFEEIAEDYFYHAFGEDGSKCQAYLDTISKLIDPVFLRGEKMDAAEEVLENLTKVPSVIQEFKPVVEKNMDSENLCWKKSWEYMAIHLEYCKHFASVVCARAMNDKEGTMQLLGEFKTFIQKNEDALQPVYDVFEFIFALKLFNDFLLKFED